jgi:hypothetical protein
MTDVAVDLPVDMNTIDETRLLWSFLDESPHPERVVPGAFIVVGEGSVRAVAVAIDVAGDVVHVQPLPGSLEANLHRLTHDPAAS